ncbi:hypothetical protein KCP77_02235 [Salmonella enterica subsp. enterica]|nr:hypothetical protein KCP77_02235 [Salmonella enterica subsp. enterica]
MLPPRRCCNFIADHCGVVCISAKERPGVLVLTAILTSLIGTFYWSLTAIQHRCRSLQARWFRRGIASAFAAAFYTTAFGLIAQYGTLPVVGKGMSFGGLILLTASTLEGALCGERQSDSGLFLPCGDQVRR